MGRGERGSLCVEGSALPKSVENGNLSLNRAAVRRMSVNRSRLF
jgi:hypothetical protein